MEKNASSRSFYWFVFCVCVCGGGCLFVCCFCFCFLSCKATKNWGINSGSAGSTKLPVTASLQGAGPDKALQIRAAKCCHPAGASEGDQGFRGAV